MLGLFKKKEVKTDLIRLLLDNIKADATELAEKAGSMSVDRIEFEISKLHQRLHALNSDYKNAEMAEFRFVNLEYMDEIFEDIAEINDKHLKSNQRQEIAEALEKYFDYDLPKKDKLDMTEWLMRELKLNDRYLYSIQENMYTPKGLPYRGVVVDGYLSYRQLGTMESSLNGARRGDINVAFHEMIDFIENDRIDRTKPISNFEKICLKNMCDSIMALK